MMFKPYGKRTTSSFILASRMSDLLDTYPSLFLAVQKLRLKHARHRIIGPNHKLMIEAFPRSGSSFAPQAFKAANPQDGQHVATHMHRASQVIRASRLGVPALILVRSPRDAVISLLALGMQDAQLPILSSHEVEACLSATLLRYARFHERIADVSGLAVAGFDEVTEDLGRVIRRLNVKFGTDFMPFNHTEAAVSELMKSSKRHLSPNADRDAIKASLVAAYDSYALLKNRTRADAAYASMIAKRNAQRAEGK